MFTIHNVRTLVALAGFLLALGVLSTCARAAMPISQDRTVQKRERYHWYELTDSQDARLRAALRDWKTPRSVLILSATADSLGLAEDIDSALRDTGHTSSIDRPMDTMDGVHCTDAGIVKILRDATGIACELDADETGGTGPVVINFGRKR